MHSTVETGHPEVDGVLGALVRGASAVLGRDLVGVYAIGSLASGDFDRHSDLDFVVAVDSDLPIETLGALQAMHGRIHALPGPWSSRLDGSYVPRSILRRRDPPRARLPYLENGSRVLVPSAHCNRHVIRWMVREQSRVLTGPPPRELVDPIDSAAMAEEVRGEMGEWLEEIRADPESIGNRHAQPYAVIGYCRLLFTLETGGVASKAAAADWAMQTLAARWRPLIEKAVAQRPEPERRAHQPADRADVRETFAFVEAAVERAGGPSGRA